LSDVGWRLGLLSDCSSELVEVWAETPFAGLFDAVGFSFRLGVRKPDPRGYLAVASQLQVPPEQCWYVGDGSSGELTGAAAVGMRPVLVTNAALAATVTHLRHDPDPYVPAHSIADLADLTSVVGHPTPDVVVTP
jgi:putative hydrolase of the HAD superfamily